MSKSAVIVIVLFFMAMVITVVTLLSPLVSCGLQASPYILAVSPGSYSGPEDVPVELRYTQTPCPVGYYCTLGVRSVCPAGYFGASAGLASSSCSGVCAPGYYCAAGSRTATQFPCGDASVYCPAGASAPIAAALGDRTVGPTAATRNATVLCDASQYCVNGTAFPCPAGRFGCATGLGTAECNGPSAPGFYCPAGSGSNHAQPCGNASVYCPEGAPAPITVQDGYYSLGGPSSLQQSQQALCPVGSFCVGGVRVRVEAVRR